MYVILSGFIGLFLVFLQNYLLAANVLARFALVRGSTVVSKIVSFSNHRVKFLISKIFETKLVGILLSFVSLHFLLGNSCQLIHIVLKQIQQSHRSSNTYWIFGTQEAEKTDIVSLMKAIKSEHCTYSSSSQPCIGLVSSLNDLVDLIKSNSDLWLTERPGRGKPEDGVDSSKHEQSRVLPTEEQPLPKQAGKER
jgi:hypothetical protein